MSDPHQGKEDSSFDAWYEVLRGQDPKGVREDIDPQLEAQLLRTRLTGRPQEFAWSDDELAQIESRFVREAEHGAIQSRSTITTRNWANALMRRIGRLDLRWVAYPVLVSNFLIVGGFLYLTIESLNFSDQSQIPQLASDKPSEENKPSGKLSSFGDFEFAFVEIASANPRKSADHLQNEMKQLGVMVERLSNSQNDKQMLRMRLPAEVSEGVTKVLKKYGITGSRADELVVIISQP